MSLVGGSYDINTGKCFCVANAADYQREIPRNTLLELDNMGHLPHEESPQRALPAVEKFLMEPFHG